MMSDQPTYEDLERRVQELEAEAASRKDAYVDMRRTERRFRAIFDQAPLGIAVIDSRTGGFLHINDAFCEIVGYPRTEMLTMDFMRITHPDDLQEDLDNMARLRAGEISGFQMDKRYFKKDGDLVWVTLTVVPLWEESTDPLHHIAIVEDITAAKRTERELRESRNRYQSLFQAASDAIFVAALDDGTLLDANDKAEELIGRSRDELIGMHQTELHPPEQEAKARSSFQDLPPGREGTAFVNIDVQHKDGSHIPVEISQAYFDIQGKPCVLGIFRDVSAQKEASEALQKSESRLRQAQHVARIGSWDMDAQTGDGNWSDELFLLLGYAPGEKPASYRLFREHVHPEDVSRFEEQIARYTSRAKYVDEVFRFVTVEGDVRIAHSIGDVEFDEDGNPIRAYGTFQDVTDQERVREALKTSEEHLRLITDNLPALIAHIDKNLTCLFANKAYLTLCGVRPETMIGRRISETLDKEAFERAHPFIVKALAGETVDMENHVAIQDGRYAWFRVTFVPHLDGNEVEGYFVLGWDITDRKRAEEALQHSLAEKEVLLREIHHRVKNNMQAIISMLRMYARRAQDSRLKEIFAACQGRIEAMSLIHESLYQSEDLAKVDLGAYLGNLCRNLAQVHGSQAGKIALTLNVAKLALTHDHGVAVGTVVAELVSNAFKHAFPEGREGTVFITLDRLEEDTVRLVVADTGKGLPAGFDLESPLSLGMRLATLTVTRELGGSIEATNEGGARFVVLFKCPHQS